MRDPSRDVTELVLRHREACRVLWNGYLRDPDFDGTVSLDDERHCDFHRVQGDLFTAIVLRSIGRADVAPRFGTINQPVFDFLRVVAKPNGELLVNREPAHDGNQYWDGAPKRVPRDIDLRLTDYFDWDVWGSRDFAYFLTRIVACSDHPDIVGRDALVRVTDCRVLVIQPS